MKREPVPALNTNVFGIVICTKKKSIYAFRSRSMHSTISSAINHAMHFTFVATVQKIVTHSLDEDGRWRKCNHLFICDTYLANNCKRFPMDKWVYPWTLNWIVYFLRTCNFRCIFALLFNDTEPDRRGDWPRAVKSIKLCIFVSSMGIDDLRFRRLDGAEKTGISIHAMIKCVVLNV